MLEVGYDLEAGKSDCCILGLPCSVHEAGIRHTRSCNEARSQVGQEVTMPLGLWFQVFLNAQLGPHKDSYWQGLILPKDRFFRLLQL